MTTTTETAVVEKQDRQPPVTPQGVQSPSLSHEEMEELRHSLTYEYAREDIPQAIHALYRAGRIGPAVSRAELSTLIWRYCLTHWNIPLLKETNKSVETLKHAAGIECDAATALVAAGFVKTYPSVDEGWIREMAEELRIDEVSLVSALLAGYRRDGYEARPRQLEAELAESLSTRLGEYPPGWPTFHKHTKTPNGVMKEASSMDELIRYVHWRVRVSVEHDEKRRRDEEAQAIRKVREDLKKRLL